jgi:signal transduction histidine kinase
MTELISSNNVLAQLPAIVFILRYRLPTDDFHAEYVSSGTGLDLGAQPPNGSLFSNLAEDAELPPIVAALRAAAHGRRRFECEFPLKKKRKASFIWARALADPSVLSPQELQFTGTIVDASAPRLAHEHLSAILNSDRAQLRATAAALQERLREVEELKAAVQQFRHREQVRIGHDLHDGLGQELAAIVLQIKKLEVRMSDQPADLVNALTAIRELAHQRALNIGALAEVLSPVSPGGRSRLSAAQDPG